MLKAGTAGLKHLPVFSTGTAGPLPSREKKHGPRLTRGLLEYCRLQTGSPGYLETVDSRRTRVPRPYTQTSLVHSGGHPLTRG